MPQTDARGLQGALTFIDAKWRDGVKKRCSFGDTHLNISHMRRELNYAGTSPQRETGEWNLKHLIQNDLVGDMNIQLLKTARAPVEF